MEMEENKWLIINQYAARFLSNSIVIYIPGRDIRPFMLNYANTIKPPREFLQVFLVGTASCFHTLITPLDAPVSPPLQAFEAVVVPPKRHPTDVVQSKSLQVLIFLRESVFNN